MLVLTRRIGEQIVIGGNIRVTVLAVKGHQVYLDIAAASEARTISARGAERKPLTKLHVFLADDHPVVCQGLKSLINAQSDREVAGEAGNGESTCELVAQLHPDVVLLDVSMPGMSCAQTVERLKQECPEVKVVALTVHEDKTYLRRLLETGVAGYVLKRAAAEEFILAIRTVAAGGVYLDAALAGKVVGGFLRKPAVKSAPDVVNLSDREAEVVRFVAAGHSNKEIAGRLDLSVKTVETYKARSLEKLDLHSRADLVRYALQRGWLQNT